MYECDHSVTTNIVNESTFDSLELKKVPLRYIRIKMKKMLIQLNVIDREGKKTNIEIEEGTTIRDAIEEKISPESYGICGGNCNCGTCHVYVDPNDFKKLKNLEEDEIEILKKFADKPNANSRLACQVELKKEYNDMTVTIAKESVDNLSEL